MSFRTIGMVAACLGLSVSSAVAQQGGDASAAEDWTVTVIELGYADAAEVAALLSQIVPPGVKVVPYYQTNSLIISGDRALIEELTQGGNAGAGNNGGAEREAVDRSPPAASGDLIARR